MVQEYRANLVPVRTYAAAGDRDFRDKAGLTLNQNGLSYSLRLFADVRLIGVPFKQNCELICPLSIHVFFLHFRTTQSPPVRDCSSIKICPSTAEIAKALGFRGTPLAQGF